MKRRRSVSMVFLFVLLSGCATMRGPTQDIGESSDPSVLIAHLRSPSEEHRIKASNLLSKSGDKLDKSQVDEIIEMMRNGRDVWKKFLYRRGHCTWFEHTTVKYYAADTLIKMKSPDITNEILNEVINEILNEILDEAIKARNNGKTKRRVTDPGWVCY